MLSALEEKKHKEEAKNAKKWEKILVFFYKFDIFAKFRYI
jgi:hypothetical protein